MRLTTYSDYALRCLIFLAIQEDQEKLLNIKNIAEEFEISQNHLTKIIHQLATIGYIESVRGRNGGIRLAKSPASINLAEVIKQTEADFNLVECFAPLDKELFFMPQRQGQALATTELTASHCKISPRCQLQRIFFEATQSFLNVLNQYTLADVISNKAELRRLLAS
ncbi:HTH-type transcriptional repressor NsrR [Oligella urethralis]|uniref:RrF2 family transcriptional regulator n=1 Tax=Oligella urethralis TaxID=90245 RepID=UPI000661660D|nr:Rrf2 family transcriptional regulator [Oligella urethralis]AVL70131.1 Rrf2 family transcriptional regulator [Oligella urethralis]SUA52942.1 HTH-type transcriptional repressor NsrR [Oligella urethralis]